MYIKNFINPTSERSLLYGEDKMLGLVVKTSEEYKKDNVIGVFISKLMFGLPINNGAYEDNISIKKDNCLNSVNKSIGKNNIKIKNYVTLQVSQTNNVLPPKYAKGENVWVTSVDRDLKNLFVLPYTLGEVNKRKNDIWTLMVPNFEKYDNSDMTFDNTFGFQIDTKDKVISLWTSKTGGKDSGEEKGVYYFGINAKDGKVVLSDSGKRVIQMGTDDDSLTYDNEAGSHIDITKDTLYAKIKHVKIEAEEDIEIKTSKLKRDCDEINTTSDKDTEEVDELNIKGNKLNSNYNNTKIESSSYENKTSKWKCDSPIAGFTKVLTANSFSIWGNAGVNPMPTCANISSSGVFTSGNPCTVSMGLAKAQPVISCLNSIAAKVDTIGSIVYCPPTSVAAVAALTPLITSKNSMG